MTWTRNARHVPGQLSGSGEQSEGWAMSDLSVKWDEKQPEDFKGVTHRHSRGDKSERHRAGQKESDKSLKRSNGSVEHFAGEPSIFLTWNALADLSVNAVNRGI